MMQGAGSTADQTTSGRQFVILSREDPGAGGGLAPIGPRAEILGRLLGCNTGPETADVSDVLYGPGFQIELTPNQDPITQMLVTVTEEEIGWQVLTRLIHELQWKLLDPMTGRELTPQPPTPEA